MRYMATRTAKKQYIILLYGFNSTGALTGYFLIMTGRYFLVMTGHYSGFHGQGWTWLSHVQPWP